MEQVSEETEISRSIAGWKQEVNQVRLDLGGLGDRLQDRAAQLRQRDDLAEVEHFQNQFICQKEVADELFHDLKQASRRLSGRPSDHEAGVEELGERMETFLRLYEAMRSDFDGFIEKSA